MKRVDSNTHALEPHEEQDPPAPPLLHWLTRVLRVISYLTHNGHHDASSEQTHV